MTSNQPMSLATSKSTNASPQLPSPSQSQAPILPSHDNFSQRRSGGSGSFGAGASTRATTSAARNTQGFRKQNKAQRRPRLADEDAAAESVRWIVRDNGLVMSVLTSQTYQAAIRSTSSRKGQTSITHLMNFTLPPRPQGNPHTNFGRNGRRNPTWGLGSGHHAVDKARYIHANYRFIVDPRGDYRVQATDADISLDWGLVLQILASAQSQTASCPICLSRPVAPRMAKCGHIFCLPCLIRYMHSSDDAASVPEKKARWKKCPICWDSIYLSETRPVRWFVGQEGDAPREAEDVVLRLMMRQAGSTLALPRDGAETLSTSDEIPWYFAAEVTDYARVMKGSEDYMLSHLDREITELQFQEKEDELLFGEETVWTKKAVASILEAKGRVEGIGNPPSAPMKPEERKIKRPSINFTTSDEDIPDFYMVQHAAKSGQSIGQNFGSSSNSLPRSPSTNPNLIAEDPLSGVVKNESSNVYQRPLGYLTQAPSHLNNGSRTARHTSKGPGADGVHQSGSPFFFYQALLHYYLSPLDIRILKAAFGDFSAFPATILPRVERVSTGHIVDDELRKRAKYLAHLPYGCEVGFLECNWTDVVAPEILHGFTEEIERRRKKNNEKEIREEKERVRAEKSEDERRWAAARRKRPSVSEDHFSSVETSTSIGIDNSGQLSSSLDLTAPSASPPWLSSQNRTGSAFASLASPSTSPLAPRTVWGTTAVVPSSPVVLPMDSDHDVPDNDGWLQGWEQDLLHEDDLVVRFQASYINPSEYIGAGTTNGSGKKKRSKKITLMTTNARRGA
ncbi:hypothetical protein MMC18_005612 [Xylographa bjoerkii]|nr:hypothetical protein [Xylographa bjoerkii]